jgi:HlyD family secretion protein
VIVDVPNPDMKLLPGMTASITVMVEELKDILKVPASALKFTPPQEYLAELEKKLPDSVKQQREKWARSQQGGTPGGSQGGTPGGMPGSGRGPGGSAMGGGRPNVGRVWIVDGADLKQVRVRVGPSDGSSTEVRGRNIKEGDVVVTGIISAAAKNAQKQQNPFAPQMPQGGRGGR